MTAKKFTFKTEKSTGKWRAFYKPSHYIKRNKNEVGMIGAEAPFRIRFMIVKDEKYNDNNPNCSWMWIVLKHESNSLEEAKKFVNDNFEEINKQYNLYESKNHE